MPVSHRRPRCTVHEFMLTCVQLAHFVLIYLEMQCITAFRATCDIYMYATCIMTKGQKTTVPPLCYPVVYTAAA